jgi:hypothetical protein
MGYCFKPHPDPPDLSGGRLRLLSIAYWLLAIAYRPLPFAFCPLPCINRLYST